MSIESVTPSNHLILCRPLLLLPSIFPGIRVFSNESALRMRWPKYWSFSFYTPKKNKKKNRCSKIRNTLWVSEHPLGARHCFWCCNKDPGPSSWWETGMGYWMRLEALCPPGPPTWITWRRWAFPGIHRMLEVTPRRRVDLVSVEEPQWWEKRGHRSNDAKREGGVAVTGGREKCEMWSLEGNLKSAWG